MTAQDGLIVPVDRYSCRAHKIHESDNVAVMLDGAFANTTVGVGGAALTLRQNIDAGHKVAVAAIESGSPVVKYGGVIGIATKSIAVGEHVHSHNLKTALDGAEEYVFENAYTPCHKKSPDEWFRGFRRQNGSVGTRNEIWIIPTVGCVANIAERIAQEANRRLGGQLDGVHAFPHPFGCSQLGDDLHGTRNILASLGGHPNAGGVLFIGLGCESNQLDALLASAPFLDERRIRWFGAQGVDDEYAAGLLAVQELVAVAKSDERTDCGIDDLVIGVKCGGSDGFSGLTANPLVGRMTDRVTYGGGASIITEIPELFGAERPLMARAESKDVFDKVVRTVNGFKDYFIAHDQPVYENPSPGNKAGGITTLEEKSLGAVQKAGVTAAVSDVIFYGARIQKKGLSILEAPGNDAVSSTALAAAGATLILFTTGRGTPLGFPAPTIKISSNSPLAARKSQWIDFDAGPVLSEMKNEDVEEALWRKVLAVASGEETRAEQNGERSIAIWKRGVTL